MDSATDDYSKISSDVAPQDAIGIILLLLVFPQLIRSTYFSLPTSVFA
jgi:hypothetical protein